jgi:hypothetical protein
MIFSGVISPTCTSVAYSANTCIGGLQAMGGLFHAPASGGGTITKLVLSDAKNQKVATDVVFFRSNPSATTFTDDAVIAMAAADLKKVAGHASISAIDYITFTSTSGCEATVVPNITVKLNTTSVLYAALITRGTPTYTAAALQLTITGIE